MLKTLIAQYQNYLHLQRRISKAIANRDENLLDQLKQSSEELFVNIEANQKDLIDVPDIKGSRQSSFITESPQLVVLMEQAQRQVHENEVSLQSWLVQMKADIQQYRSSQSHRGVLASYVQQKQAISHRITQSKSTSPSSQVGVVPTVTHASGPWVVPSQTSDIVGHQFNEQS